MENVTGHEQSSQQALAVELLQRIDAAHRAGRAAEGTLRVIAPHALGQDLLMHPLYRYLRENPRVDVEWLLHDRRPDFITENIDCAIQVGEIDECTLVAALRVRCGIGRTVG